jgi:hypothetical protein
MSRERHAQSAIGRRAFLKASLPAAGLIASGAADGILAQGQAAQTAPQPASDQQCKGTDERFAEDVLVKGSKDFGEDAPRGRDTLVVHFYGLVAFVRRNRLIGGDPMRVWLPSTSADMFHNARLWVLADFSPSTPDATIGRFKVWNLAAADMVTQVDLQQEGGCKKKKGNRRNHPWEDCDFISNLREVFPQGKLWRDREVAQGAKGNITAYCALPGGTLISGTPWSPVGQRNIWKYEEQDTRVALPIRHRTLTDNVSFFRTLPVGQNEVSLKLIRRPLDPTTEPPSGPPPEVKLMSRDGIIACAITHAMPCHPASSAKHAAAMAEGRLVHSAFYYKLFRNGAEAKKAIPAFSRGVRGEAPTQLGLTSTDDGHCECGCWP